MKIKRSIALLAILGVTTLFSADMKSVDALIEKINNTTDIHQKGKLMEDLNIELQLISPKQYQEARELVNKKLRFTSNS